MNFNLPSLVDAEVRGKKVFLRCDLDVPLRNGQIIDDTRLIASISTVEHLLENGANVIVGGHLGRPEGSESEMSLLPIAKWFASEFPGSSLIATQLGGTQAWKLKENLHILENLRFDPGEEKNDSAFTHKLAYISDLFVNEAFGSSHRAHSSIVGLPRLLPHFAGFHFIKEIKILSSLVENPRRPLTIIVGGAKIETKLPLISRMHKFADYVLVGGELAENDKELAIVAHEETPDKKSILLIADLTPDKKDITAHSSQNFSEVIKSSETIIWNGPMGEFETGNDTGTKEVSQAIIESNAYKVAGGGDTLGYLNKEGTNGKFSFVSVGGGAMLEFLSGESLPGILALQS